MDPLLTKLLPADPRRRRLAALVAVAAGAVVLGVAVAVAAVGADGGVVRVTAAPRAAASPSPTPTALLVQVSGAVRRPGVVAVPEGSRALDAIAAAGGTTPAADESQVNLAARVADGQLLLVPVRGAGAPIPAGASPTADTGPISLSSATEQQLETLPRVGPSTAARIIAWRSAHGGFSKVADLLQVGGIGPKTLAGLQGLVVP